MLKLKVLDCCGNNTKHDAKHFNHYNANDNHISRTTPQFCSFYASLPQVIVNGDGGVANGDGDDD